MRNIIILILVLIVTYKTSICQIKLPKGFKCSLGINHPNESYFTDGSFTFQAYPWGHDGIQGQDVIDVIEENYSHKIKFKKTKDNLYWATGKIDNLYVYVIVVDESFQLTLSSHKNNSQFSNYSTWMLQQIRNNLLAKEGIFFTDYLGNDCFGLR